MAPQLKVVRELSREDVILHLNNGYKSLSDLERRSGIDRKILEGLQEEIDPKRQKRLRMPPRKNLNLIPLPAETTLGACVVDPKPIPRTTFGLKLTAFGASMLGLWLLGIGVVLNWQFNWTLGHDWNSSFLLAGQGAAIDLAPSFFMPFAGDLWIRRYRLMAAIALILWGCCVYISMISYTSFTATNVGDTIKSRKVLIARGADLTKRLETAQADLAKAKQDKGKQDEEVKRQEGNVWTARSYVPVEKLKTSGDCKPELITTSFFVCDQLVQFRKKLESAQNDLRENAATIVKLDAKVSDLETQLKEVPAIGGADEGSEGFSRMTGGFIRPDQVAQSRVSGSVLTLIVPGFLFMFARVLLRSFHERRLDAKR